MAEILNFPHPTSEAPSNSPKYADRLKTMGDHWVRLEKRLLDQAEFLEAMILVLDDVKLTNIRNRDYGMMDVVSEEIPLFQNRLEEVKRQLVDLRHEYAATLQAVNRAAN